MTNDRPAEAAGLFGSCPSSGSPEEEDQDERRDPGDGDQASRDGDLPARWLKRAGIDLVATPRVVHTANGGERHSGRDQETREDRRHRHAGNQIIFQELSGAEAKREQAEPGAEPGEKGALVRQMGAGTAIRINPWSGWGRRSTLRSVVRVCIAHI